jgi:hypothetical protein
VTWMSGLLARLGWRPAQFLAGAVVLAHETFAMERERPYLIAAAVGLMGLPFLLAADARLRRNGRDDEPGERP